MSNLQPTPEELAAVKLLADFQKAVQGKIPVYQAAMQEYQKKAQAVYDVAALKVDALSDADLDAAVIAEVLKQNPPMDEAAARAQIAGASREQKVGFLGQEEAVAKAGALSDADLDAETVKGLTAKGMPEDQAAAKVSQAPREQKVIFVAHSLIGSTMAAGLSDADLDEAVVQKLVEQTSEAAVTAQVAKTVREDKVGFLAETLAAPEIERIPAPVDPQAEVLQEMNIDPDDINEKLGAFVNKYGKETLQKELSKFNPPAP